jgi:L-ascorbate metabolism protein UlaG (beta-lactamase superfamily)
MTKRRILLTFLAAAATLFGGGVILGWFFSAPKYRGAKSDHFDGRRFHNLQTTTHAGFSDMVRWMANRDQGPWQKWREITPAAPPPRRVAGGALRVTWVNHSTFLIQTEGLNILTDPIWSERCSPVSFAGPKRHHAPGIRFEDLPPIDVVLISHNHYDHMDVHTLRRLEARDRPRFVTGTGNGPFLRARGLSRVDELTWWQSIDLGAVRVTMGPAQHFSARTPFDRNRTLWGSFVIEGDWPRVFFAADTGYWRHFEEVRASFGAIELALLPIGAYEPRWFMRPAHMNPADAVQAHLDLQARLSVAMHFGTFRLTDEARDEPPQQLGEALDARGVPRDRFRVLRPGQTLTVPS